MRHMSFALTTAQVRARTKTVTRRMRWFHAVPGMVVQPVVKAMGLKPGEKVQRIGGPIRILDVRRERLDAMLTNLAYGHAEVAREGFAGHPDYGDPGGFVAMFCNHNGCQLFDDVTRIEFEYVDRPSQG